MTSNREPQISIDGYTDSKPGKTNMTLSELKSLLGTTITIAASNADANSIANANYICDGVNDQVQIQEAIDSLPTVGGSNNCPIGGGKIILSEGTFNCASGFDLDGELVIIEGQGEQETCLSFTFGASAPCFKIDNTNDLKSRVVLRDFYIKGDDTNTTYGLYIEGAAALHRFYNLAISNMATAGVKGLSGNSQNHFSHVYIRDVPAGFDMYGNTNEYYACIASNGQSGTAAGSAFHSQEAESYYYGCFGEGFEYGYNIDAYAYGVALFGCCSEKCNYGIRFGGSSPNQPVGCSVYGGLVATSRDATDPAIFIDRCNGILINGLCVYDSTSNKAFYIDSTATDVVITGGYTNDTTPITNMGGTRINITNLSPYVNKSGGAAASISDGGTIPHGLSSTPTWAIVSPSIASEFVSVTTLDGTNITVAIKKHDNSAGTSQTIYWSAGI